LTARVTVLVIWAGLAGGCTMLRRPSADGSPWYNAAGSAPATAAGPGADFPGEPILRIESGMHTAVILRIDVDAAGARMVTASADRTARLWNLESGEQERVLRPPTGHHDGSLYAAAMAPDGATVAVGGHTPEPGGRAVNVYLFSTADGALKRRIGGLPANANHLAFSRDGGQLAVAMGSGGGVAVFASADGRRLWGQDYRQRDEPEKSASSFWAEFDREGRLLVSSDDGQLRLYAASGPAPPQQPIQPLRQVSVGRGARAHAARFSPDGKLIAVGLRDRPGLEILDGRTLARVRSVDCSAFASGDLSSVAWSWDGQELFAGGRHRDAKGVPLVSWSQAGAGLPVVVARTADAISDIRALPDGTLVVGTTEPRWLVLRGPRVLLERGPAKMDLREGRERLTVSADGRQVQFASLSSGDGKRASALNRFNLSALDQLLDHPLDAPLRPAQMDGLPIARWRNSAGPTLAGRPLPLDPEEESRSLAIAPDHSWFVLGTEWHLRRFGRDRRSSWTQRIPETAWAVNITGDRRFVVAALGDGTVRWYAADSGRPRLALFAHPDGRWIAWTPEGFYAAAPKAERLAGYHVNQGPDRAATFVELGQLEVDYNRPDLIGAALAPDGPDRIASALERVSGRPSTLVYEVPGVLEARFDRRGNQVDVTLRLKKGVSAQRLQLRVNDGPILEVRGAGLRIPGESSRTITVPAGAPVGEEITHTVTLPPDAHTLEAVLVSPRGVKTPPFRVQVPAPGGAVRPSTLHVLAAGVSAYSDAELRAGVSKAVADAQAVAQRLKERAAGLFATTDVTVLRDRQVTVDGLEAAFARIARRVRPGDVFVLYLAGHGTSFDGAYYYYPQDLVIRRPADLEEKAISARRLASLVSSVPATHRVWLVDTCRAGALAGEPLLASRGDMKSALLRLRQATGDLILAAARGDRDAYQVGAHGAFTAALLEALEGKGSPTGSSHVTTREVADYVVDRVPKLTAAHAGVVQRPMVLGEPGSLKIASLTALRDVVHPGGNTSPRSGGNAPPPP
jgi:hypothetical protein